MESRMRRGRCLGAVALSVAVLLLVRCVNEPTPTVSPVPTVVSPLDAPGMAAESIGGTGAESIGGARAGSGEEMGVAFTGVITREIVLAWDGPETPVGWVQIGVDEPVVGTDVLTWTMRFSSGELFVFTGTVESGVVKIPEIDYGLDCDYRLMQDGETIQSGVIVNSVRPLTETGLYDLDAVPGSGVYAVIEYNLPVTFEGMAELWERCCWTAGEPWPVVCVRDLDGVQDAAGYWMADFVMGMEGLERWWLPMIFRGARD